MSILNLHTFAASNLADSEGLKEALTVLESRLTGPEPQLDLVLRDLCSIPYLFEFVMSVWSRSEWLALEILHAYPSKPAILLESSAPTLLRHLSSVIFSLPPDLFSPDISRHIGQYKVYVEDVLHVLFILCSADFSSASSYIPASTDEPEYEDNDKFLGFTVRNKKQKKQKRKDKANGLAIDIAPFLRLGAKVPINISEATQLAQEITDNLRMVLEFYLKLLRQQSLAQPIKDAFVSANENRSPQPAVHENNKDVAEVVESTPPAFPMVQPIKAALYFDNADGFGEWRILINADATKKLRELVKSDKKKCAIVVKKIKQLSNGHFSEGNQKRLNSVSGVPIFEAKMQRDLRLVYQIDVVPDHDNVDRQVIKIYGIHTHTQVNRIWDAVAQHLAGKGGEYRRRCIFRNPPLNPGGDTYLPASFPADSLLDATKRTPLVLSDEDMGELHSLLVLEKYTTFSQAFLHSLIINHDVQHVFELTPQERKIVECKTSCYVLGRSGTGKTTTMLFKMLGIQRAWEMQPNRPKPRQIFVTKSRVLATKVEEYFTKLLESLALAGYSLEELKRAQVKDQESGLVDLDDVPEVQTGIPSRYSALEDNHFPLFVTFDKLAKMIAADVFSSNDSKEQHAAEYFIDTDDIQGPGSCVTYDIFARTYWPHFPQPLTKGLEPWLVFSEMIGIIKGSERSLSCPDGHLDKDTYLNLPARSNPTFANQREVVYAIFEVYSKLKKERRHHDVADRTHAILRSLLGGTSLTGQRIHFIYVDEAQDNLLIDALVLRLICCNPEGLFWAGDTAQTISAGSSFRFNDLKAFLYRIEQDQRMHLIQERSISDPEAFQLAINYRSHGGIVNCAHTVIERITRFWPDAIDGLQPEHGVVEGLKPVFFRGWDQDTARYEQFLFGASGSRIEFGAQQCILVRDHEAVEKLRKEVGDIGLIMTLYDSKGLEFNDVLLYNFFEDSVVDISRWRVLLNHIDGEVDGRDLSKIPAPSFERDEGRFAGVCSELKLLYVGITRARKNLWIFDKSDKGEPMRMVWTARGQIQNCTPGTDVPHLAVSSTPAEWESFGNDLFKHKRYPQAMHCFERALLPAKVAVCQAFHLRELARAKVGVASLKVQQEAFYKAADAFMARGTDAAKGKEKLQYYRNAAECYIRAGDDQKAAIGYLAAEEYDLAARQYRKAGLFGETLEVLHKFSSEISAESSEELYTVCRLFYCSKPDAIRPPLLFSSFEEELEFLEDYGFDLARASLLESRGRFLEAAELHLAENRPLAAIGDFLKAKGSPEAAKRATEIVLSGLWHRCSFGTPAREVAANTDVIQLLELAQDLPDELMDPLDHAEISMFRAIVGADQVQLSSLAETFVKKGRDASALLALDHVFSHLPSFKSFNLEDMLHFLEKFRQYTQLLYQVISDPKPLNCKLIKRLFCITEISNTEYSMKPGSFLHRPATGDRSGPKYLQAPKLTISKQDMVVALRQRLSQHLCHRVTLENEQCYEATVFSQCLTFIVNDHCNHRECSSDHVNRTTLDMKHYNIRIAVHLQQLCILQIMYSANPHLRVESRYHERVLTWLDYLYDAFNSEFHVQGSIANLDLSMMPSAHEGIMRHWIKDALYGLRTAHDPPGGFLTIALKLIKLLFAFDKPGALRFINQASFIAHHPQVTALSYPDGHYLVDDIVALFHGETPTCILSGLLLLQHILRFPLFVNLSVVCDCLELVVSRIVVSWQLLDKLPLDGLVLPRHWLSPKDVLSTSLKYVSIDLLLGLLDSVRNLLVHLQPNSILEAPRTYMLPRNELTPILCTIFTARICRTICLLAYNMRNGSVREKVESIFQLLRTADPAQTTHHLYRGYVEAGPNGYLRAISNYSAEVVIEDMVQLLHRRGMSRNPPPQLPGIKQVHYDHPSNIPSLLAARLDAARSDTRANAPPVVPEAAYTSQMKAPEGPKGEDAQPDSEGMAGVKPAHEIQEEPQEVATLADEPALVQAHNPTNEEIVAAKRIQVAYRAYRKRRSNQARAMGNGLKAQTNVIFVACLRNVYTLKWQKSPYRTLYLWALPYLVTCLDKIMVVAHECNGKMKKKLLKESHERLEELGQQMNKITALLKAGRKLRKDIDPNTDMHERKGADRMKKAFMDVKDLLYQLPTDTPELQDHLNVAYELVMVEKTGFKKAEKPELNTEDLDFLI